MPEKNTSTPQLFHCPTCGASLPVPDAASVKCEYCGSNVLVPPEYHAKDDSQYDWSAAELQRGTQRSAIGTIITIVVALVIIGAVVTVILVATGIFATMGFVSSAISSTTLPGIEVLLTSTPVSRASKGLEFGGEGSGPGQFNDPRYIAVDLDGNIYVADYDSGRVQKFDPSGKFIYLINVEPDRNDNILIRGMATDYAGKLYIVRGGDILIYNAADGSHTGTIPGDSPATYYDALAISPANELYALHDTASGQDLIKLDQSGQVLWRQVDIVQQVDKKARASTLKLAVDGLGNTFILNQLENQVYRFGPDGTYNDRFGSKGENPGQFRIPTNIAVDGKGRVYITDANKIHVFDENGTFLETLLEGSPAGVFRAIVFDVQGNMYAVTTNNLVIKYMLNMDE
jgi:outer membrane protein assembly factor BamB